MIPRMPLSTGPLIGRDTDLSRLADAIGLRPTPGARPGGVVVLSGDAGIGKSRIVGHLVADATASDWFTAVGHCVGQAGSSLAYLPFVELVGTIDAGHPDVVERVLETHPSLGHLLPGRADAPDRAPFRTQHRPRPGRRGRPRPAVRARRRPAVARRRRGRPLGRPLLARPHHPPADPWLHARGRPRRDLPLRRPLPPPPPPRDARRVGAHRGARARRARPAPRRRRARARLRHRGRPHRRRDERRDRPPLRGQPVLRRGARRERRRRPGPDRRPEPRAPRPRRAARRHRPARAAGHRPQGRPVHRPRPPLARRRPPRRDARGRAGRRGRAPRPRGPLAAGLHLPPRPPR